MTYEERWQATLDALVEAEINRRLDRGQLIRDENTTRILIRRDYEAQAERRPRWKQQQIDKHHGSEARPGKLTSCPRCGIQFKADPPPNRAAAPEPGERFWPCWTNGSKIVSVPPHLEADYTQRGYQLMDEQPPPVCLPEVDEQPTAGADGLLYCRASCAAAQLAEQQPELPVEAETLA